MKRLLIFLCFWLNITLIHAQHETGLADDDPGYSKTSLIVLPSSKASLPRNVDLKPYCPRPGDQGKIASCVGWAVGYGLMTIEKAIQNNETDTRTITENAFSPLFVYNQVKSDGGSCKSASIMSDALAFLQEKGNCLAKEFKPNIDDCYAKPDANLKIRAKNNVIADFSRLFDANQETQKKIDAIRNVLARKKPIAIGLKINDYFNTLREIDYWNPRLGKEPNLTHAMVIVGYDDDAGCFTLMNSWGRAWGRDGFIKVKYRDIGDNCNFAFAIYFSKNNNFLDPLVVTENSIERPAPRRSLVAQTPVQNQGQTKNTNQTPQANTNATNQGQPARNVGQTQSSNTNNANQGQPTRSVGQPQPTNPNTAQQTPANKKVADTPPTPSHENTTGSKGDDIAAESPTDLIEMSGGLEVNYYTERWTENKEPIFETLGVVQVDNHYTLTKKDWRVGDKFQLALTSDISGAYVYIVSVNPRNEVKIMFPRHEEYGKQYAGLYESPLMMLDGARALLPSPTKVIGVDYAGTDRICVLFSIRKITNFPLFCKKIQNWNGNFDEYLYKLFGKAMIPLTDTDFSLNKIGFRVSTQSDGSIVPIIIEFKSQ